MKLNTNSGLKLISFFPLMLLLILSSYFMYVSYIHYQNSKRFLDTLNSNKILKRLSINLAKERGLSAAYLGSKGKLAKSALMQQRKSTNNAIREFNDYFKDKKLDKELTRVFKALIQISKIRKSIDSFNIPFGKMFFGYYSKINALLQDEFKKILNIQLTPEIISEVSLESDFLQEIEKSGQERGFVSYIISKKRPFTTKEFSQWLRIFTQADLTTFNINISDKKLKEKLFVIFHNVAAKKLYDTLVKAKINIIEGSDIGYYQIESPVWFKLMTEKISILDKADNQTSIRVSNEANNWFENEVRPKLTLATGILVLAIFLLVVGFFVDRYIKRSIKELEKLFGKVGQLTDIDEEIDFQTTDGIAKGYRIIEIAIDQIQQDKQIALEASKAKSIFLANMSHEIRTPLNGIIGFTELLKNTNISGEERDFVDIIEKSSENLLEIINNILDLSKIESDKIEVEEILFSPISEFENAVEVFAAKAAEKNIRLSFYMDPSLNNYLNGDPTKIKEVLINLLSNAIKFTPMGGEIDIEIKRVGSSDAFGRTKVLFLVRDNGIGISEDKLQTIFDAFSQADSTVTRKYGGTGLGLTISSKFVAMMGGKLEVKSKVAEGTKFFFTLEFDESPSSEFNFKDEFTQYRCALLANEKDRKNHTQYIYDYLKYFGCEVLFFYSYNEIKGLMYRENVNFMILDIDYISQSEIDEYKNLSIPGVVVLKSSMQSIANSYTNEYIKALYEPVNVTKLSNVLEKTKELLPKVEEISSQQLQEDDTLYKKEKREDIDKLPIKKEDKNNISVLVAEDNDINRKLIKRTLESYHIEVTLANDGKEALENIKNKRFDLIFMDIAMPVMDGVEALHAILDYEIEAGLKHTPIVALTANALKGDRERFLKEGFDEYVTKPIKGSIIDAILQMFLKDKYNDDIKDMDMSENELVREIDKQTGMDVKAIQEDDEPETDNGHEFDEQGRLKISLGELEQERDITIDSKIHKTEDYPYGELPSMDNDKEEDIEKELTSNDIEVDKKNDNSKEIDNDGVTKSQSDFIEVLIAEDNTINQKLIEKTLKSLGLQVDIASNGQEALEMFKNKKYDMVFMDISMPVMDGIEATQEILAYEKQSDMEHTPIVALTANALPGDRETFLSEGLDEYISKPLKKEDILRVLKIFLDYEPDEQKSEQEDSKKSVYEDFFSEIDGIASSDQDEFVKLDSGEEYQQTTKKDILVYKNNKIEAKILSNIMQRMGYSVDMVFNFDEFLISMENNQYKMIYFDKEMEFVDRQDIIDKIKKMDQKRGEKTVIVELVDTQDKNRSEDETIVDEILDNIIDKKVIIELLGKYMKVENE